MCVMQLSLVVPVFNELQNIVPLVSAVKAALSGYSYELIFVDDGSTDGTQAEILAQTDSQIVLVQLARNFGQTSAMAAGIEAARGDYIATLDGDLQNDPADIPLMLKKLEAEGLDIVAGRRLKRQDGALLRKIPSKIANWLIRKYTHTHIRDLGCTLKLFRSALAKQLDLYGELHRLFLCWHRFMVQKLVRWMCGIMRGNMVFLNMVWVAPSVLQATCY